MIISANNHKPDFSSKSPEIILPGKLIFITYGNFLNNKQRTFLYLAGINNKEQHYSFKLTTLFF